jgi:hypothetical protein
MGVSSHFCAMKTAFCHRCNVCCGQIAQTPSNIGQLHGSYKCGNSQRENGTVVQPLPHLPPPPPQSPLHNCKIKICTGKTPILYFDWPHSRHTGHKLRWPKSGAISGLDLHITIYQVSSENNWSYRTHEKLSNHLKKTYHILRRNRGWEWRKLAKLEEAKRMTSTIAFLKVI